MGIIREICPKSKKVNFQISAAFILLYGSQDFLFGQLLLSLKQAWSRCKSLLFQDLVYITMRMRWFRRHKSFWSKLKQENSTFYIQLGYDTLPSFEITRSDMLWKSISQKNLKKSSKTLVKCKISMSFEYFV